MRLLSLAIEDLRRLDRTTGGRLHVALREVARTGCDPELVVRREADPAGSSPSWSVSVATGGHEESDVRFAFHDAQDIAVLASIWLADLREEVAQELRDRLDCERMRS